MCLRLRGVGAEKQLWKQVGGLNNLMQHSQGKSKIEKSGNCCEKWRDGMKKTNAAIIFSLFLFTGGLLLLYAAEKTDSYKKRFIEEYTHQCNPEKIFKISSEWIKAEPDNPIPNYMIWGYYLNKGQRGKAAVFEKKGLGTSKNRSNADEVIAFFEDLCVHKKTGVLRYENLIAHICFSIKRYKKAIELYNILLEKHPDYALWHMIIAKSYSAIGNDKAAIHHYKRAARLQENDPEINYQLAYLYKKNKQYDAAAKACRKVIRQRPDYGDAYPLLLRIYMDNNEYERVIKSGKKMIIKKVYPDNYLLYFLIAKAYLKSGEYDAALKYFNLARKQKKKLKDPAYYDYAGRCYLSKGKFAEAEKYLLKSLALKPYPSLYYYLGKLYEEKKDYSQARKYYHKIITGKFSKTWKSKARKGLASLPGK